MGPAAHQTRHQVLHLRQLDLQLALGTARALRKDIEDQVGAINHAYTDNFLDVTNLDRRELVVKNDQICIVLRHAGSNFLNLPAAGKNSGVGFDAFATNRLRDYCARTGDEFHGFGQPVFEQRIVKIDADNDRLRTARRLGRSRFFSRVWIHCAKVIAGRRVAAPME